MKTIFIFLLACLSFKAFADEVEFKSNKKILVLIIASDDQPVYKRLQKIWRSYMHGDPDHIEAYFLKGNSHLSTQHKIEGDVIWSRVHESYKPGILKKTLYALHCMMPKLHQFDYVLRTNLSSFYVFENLLKFVETLPKEKCYCAQPLRSLHGIPFGWGCGFLMSPDVAMMLVNNKRDLKKYSYDNDDVVIGDFFFRNQIPIIPAPIFEIYNLKEWFAKESQIPENNFHFRIKNIYDEKRATDDIFINKELLKKYYGVDLK